MAMDPATLAVTLLDGVPPVTSRDDANPPPFTASPGGGSGRSVSASASKTAVVRQISGFHPIWHLVDKPLRLIKRCVHDCLPRACLPLVRSAGHRCQQHRCTLQEGWSMPCWLYVASMQCAALLEPNMPTQLCVTQLHDTAGHGDAVWRAGQGGRRRNLRRPGHDDRADPGAGPLQAAAEAAAARADGRGPEQRAGVALQGSGLEDEPCASMLHPACRPPW
jgi:hypothetical protein